MEYTAHDLAVFRHFLKQSLRFYMVIVRAHLRENFTQLFRNPQLEFGFARFFRSASEARNDYEEKNFTAPY